MSIEKCYKGQNLHTPFHCKQENQLTCYVETKCFHFVKTQPSKRNVLYVSV
jgi:hypothetical protein